MGGKAGVEEARWGRDDLAEGLRGVMLNAALLVLKEGEADKRTEGEGRSTWEGGEENRMPPPVSFRRKPC